MNDWRTKLTFACQTTAALYIVRIVQFPSCTAYSNRRSAFRAAHSRPGKHKHIASPNVRKSKGHFMFLSIVPTRCFLPREFPLWETVPMTPFDPLHPPVLLNILASLDFVARSSSVCSPDQGATSYMTAGFAKRSRPTFPCFDELSTARQCSQLHRRHLQKLMIPRVHLSASPSLQGAKSGRGRHGG